jgi:hypothetical protein
VSVLAREQDRARDLSTQEYCLKASPKRTGFKSVGTTHTNMYAVSSSDRKRWDRAATPYGTKCQSSL